MNYYGLIQLEEYHRSKMIVAGSTPAAVTHKLRFRVMVNSGVSYAPDTSSNLVAATIV